jgi:hypothetical protein
MPRRSWNGPGPCFLLLTGLTVALALPRAVAAGQESAPTPLVQPIAPGVAADLAVEHDSGDKQPESGKETVSVKKKRDTLKFHWRSASVDYGKKVRIDFRSKIRGEVRASDAEITKEALDELDIPRHRVGFDGRVLNALAFKVDREIESTNSVGTPTPPWRDVYVDVTQLEEVQFRYGQFKMPFSLDENTGSVALDFAYRSTTATLLAPGRARGWMVHGDTFDRAFGYEYGVFRTDGTNALARTSEKRVNAGETTAWRVTSEPLRGLNSPLADLHIGYARTSGDLPEGISGIKGRTVLGADFYKPEFYVFGRRERKAIEFQWLPGPHLRKDGIHQAHRRAQRGKRRRHRPVALSGQGLVRQRVVRVYGREQVQGTRQTQAPALPGRHRRARGGGPRGKDQLRQRPDRRRVAQPARRRAAVQHRPHPRVQWKLVPEPLDQGSDDLVQGGFHGPVDGGQGASADPELLERGVPDPVQHLTHADPDAFARRKR